MVFHLILDTTLFDWRTQKFYTFWMDWRKRLCVLAAFAVAMAYVEAMVVVYLRRLVPLEIWGQAHSYRELCALVRTYGILWSEQTREVATIVMLVSVAWLAGSDLRRKVAAFLIAFGIWDIFYYVFLYVWLRWPRGLLEWDVLFLIPVPWVSPVLVPVVISILMVVLGLRLANDRKDSVTPPRQFQGREPEPKV